MKKKNCFLWFHDWNKWEKIDEGKVMGRALNYETGKITDKGVQASFIYQERRCNRCGKYQLDYQEK